MNETGDLRISFQASFGQERIWLDEKIRFHQEQQQQQQCGIYNIPLVFKIECGQMLIEKIHRSVKLIINKHSILRTSLVYDDEKQYLKQIINLHENYSYQLTVIHDQQRQIDEILRQEEISNEYFHLDKGIVLRCHILQYKSDDNDKDVLKQGDLLIFNIHHAAFDGSSTEIFINDFKLAYTNQVLDPLQLQYFDYSQYERKMDMSKAKQYWSQLLEDYSSQQQQLLLPCDYMVKSHQRTGHGSSISIKIDPYIIKQLILYADKMNLTMFQLSLSCYYAFLFKLSHEIDLCIDVLNANRYQTAIQSLIGMFVNILPYRFRLNPQDTFEQLVKQVQQLCLEISEFTCFPYQKIIELNQYGNQILPYLQTTFLFDTSSSSSSSTKTIFDDNIQLSPILLNEKNVSIFDFSLHMNYDNYNKTLKCLFEYSTDLFKHDTILQLSQRFQCLLEQLFTSSFDKEYQPLYELSLLLSYEQQILHDINQTYNDNSSSPLLHHVFVDRCQEFEQKCCIILDQQSLTYSEFLYYVQLVSIQLIQHYNIRPQQIVCQCAERSIEMSIGIFSVLICGAIHCPLNPENPYTRLFELINDTQTKHILIHSPTEDKFINISNKSFAYGDGHYDRLQFINIQQIITFNDNFIIPIDNNALKLFSNINISNHDIAYCLFTSGSTGKPKGILIKHKNIQNQLQALNHVNWINVNDTMLQLAPCSFDSYLSEIYGCFYSGAQLICLHPQGPLDLDYTSTTIQKHQLSRIDGVPQYANSLYQFWEQNEKFKDNQFHTIRSFSLGGEAITPKLLNSFLPYLSSNCEIINSYGPAETTIACTYYVLNLEEDVKSKSISIGKPMLNYQCYVVDDYLQLLPLNYTGELVVGGVSVFHSYLNQPNLTERVLINLSNVNGKCYRTGDLCQIDNQGLIYFIGRKDFQVKLHGQRIEVGEIEQTILQSNSSITNCIVIKNDDEYLIAYVETTDVDELTIRDYCQQYLPSHMVPSFFVLMKKLPLNSNLKLDRKQLPKPNFAQLMKNEMLIVNEPQTQQEKNVYDIWCQLLQLDKIPSTRSFFSIGGNSLLLMKLYSQYQTKFNFNLSVGSLFKQSTIGEHIQLINRVLISPPESPEQWRTLNIIEGPASYAQERFWFDEQIRFSSNNSGSQSENKVRHQIAIYNIPYFYKIENGCMSIKKLIHTLNVLIHKHSILRTLLNYSDEMKCLKQTILPISSNIFKLQISHITENDEHQLNQKLLEEQISNDYFKLNQGLVFRCHVIRRESNVNYNDDDLLVKGDIIIFNFHHCAFDGVSFEIFVNDFIFAYENNKLDLNNEMLINYIDYSQYERQMDMSNAQQYWRKLLNNYDRNKELQLPYDYRLSTQIRTGRGSHVFIQIDKELTYKILHYSNKKGISLFQLLLSCYFIYLFKITQDEDLCIGVLNANRYRPEIQSLIGLFLNLIPYRLQLKPCETFEQTLEHVIELYLAITDYSYLPYQLIEQLYSNDDHMQPQTRAISSSLSTILPYIHTTFQFHTLANTNRIYLNEKTICLSEMSYNQKHTSEFDLSLIMDYCSTDKLLLCYFEYSQDIFKYETIAQMADKFKFLLEQLFLFSTHLHHQPIYKLSLILPQEEQLINKLNQTSIVVDQQSQFNAVQHLFIQCTQEFGQKGCIILDQQCLTYSEVLYYVQLVSVQLIEKYNVRPQQVICQCLERSIEMPIGILSILMNNCIYCSLNLNDPLARCLTLIDETQSKHIFIHSFTKDKFIQVKNDNTVQFINVEQIINDSCYIYNNMFDYNLLSNVITNIDNDIAFVLFTSGSTGIPKGILISHKNTRIRIKSYIEADIINKNDIVIQAAQCSFDVHLEDILGSISCGAQLVLLHSNGLLDLDYFSNTIRNNYVTHVDVVPEYANRLAEFWQNNLLYKTKQLDTIRCFILGGEHMNSKTIKLLLPFLTSKCKFFNLYGPAEATLSATCHLIQIEDLENHSIPIGYPFVGSSCYILDDYLQPVEINRVGEMFIGGSCLFQGYLNRPDLTEQALINISVHGEKQREKVYKTGDLCKINSTGQLLYVGRKDFQVKLRGQRIETGEIEQSIFKSSTDVSNCVVMKYDDYLVAYIESTVNDQTLLKMKIRQYCQLNLARYMIPSFFIILEQFPLNINRKLDRKQLPVPDLNQLLNNQEENTKPNTALEQSLHDIIVEALNFPMTTEINLNSSFNELGVTSFGMMKILTLIRKRLYSKVSIPLLFSNSSIYRLSNALRPLINNDNER